MDPCKGKTLSDCWMDLYKPGEPCDSKSNIMAAQVVLKDAGHYEDDIDGIWGENSEKAFLADGRLYSDLVPDCTGMRPKQTKPEPYMPPTPTPGTDPVDARSSSSSTVPLAIVGAMVGLGLGVVFAKKGK